MEPIKIAKLCCCNSDLWQQQGDICGSCHGLAFKDLLMPLVAEGNTKFSSEEVKWQCYSPLEFHPLAPDVQIFLITKKGRCLSCLNSPLQPRKYKARILACSSWSVPWTSCQRLLFSTPASSPRSLCPCFWLGMLASSRLWFGGGNHGIEGVLNVY